MPVVKSVVEEIISKLLEGERIEPAEFDDEGDLRDIWADTSDIERFPRGTPVQVNREHAPIHGLIGTVVKSKFDKAVIRLNPGEWERGGLVGEPEDFILPIEEITPLSESEEDLDAEDFEASAAQDVKHVDIPTLDDIKAAEPGFFSRENNKFFGTKKVYHYGNFIVLKNRRKSIGHFGNVDYHTSYQIYEFKRTEQNPQGVLIHRGSSGELSDAKAMIKAKDFRSRYERIRAGMAQPRAMPESEEDEFADVGDLEHRAPEIPAPLRFKNVPVGGIFKGHDGKMKTKVNDTDVNEEGKIYTLGNPIYMCYPPHWDYATINSVSRKTHMIPRLRENEEDDFDAEMAREIGTPDPMPDWRAHNVLKETKKFALVTFQNGKTGLVCLVPDSYPDRVQVKNPSDIKYLQNLSDSEFDMSACLEFGCGVWSSSDEESEETEREINGG